MLQNWQVDWNINLNYFLNVGNIFLQNYFVDATLPKMYKFKNV